MAKKIKPTKVKTGKDLKTEVANTLTEIFSDIKEAVGKKKFSKKVKKASKILSAGAINKTVKKEKPVKELVKKEKAAKKVKVVKAVKAVKAVKTPVKKVKKQGSKEKKAAKPVVPAAEQPANQ